MIWAIPMSNRGLHSSDVQSICLKGISRHDGSGTQHYFDGSEVSQGSIEIFQVHMKQLTGLIAALQPNMAISRNFFPSLVEGYRAWRQERYPG